MDKCHRCSGDDGQVSVLKKPIGNYTVAKMQRQDQQFLHDRILMLNCSDVSKLPKPTHRISGFNIIAKET